MGDLGIDGKLVADQCGHTLDVSQNVYRQTPVASGQRAGEKAARHVIGVQMEYTVRLDSVSR